MIDFLAPIMAVGFGAAFAGYLLWLLLLKPAWYNLDNQRERLARRLAFKLADNVLHRAFDISHITTNDLGEQVVKYVRFVTPVGDGVTLAADNPDRYHTQNHHPDSYLQVWDWSTFGLEYLPLANVELELDTGRMPYDTTIDYLLEHRQQIEQHAEAVLMYYGVIAVKLHQWVFADREHQKRRIIFKLFFRRRDKGPAIPQHVDYGEMIAAWSDFEQERQKFTAAELRERERLAARILDYAIVNFGATFPLKKLQAAFSSEISHRQIEELGQDLEQQGILQKQGGPLPRLVIVWRARQYIDQQRQPVASGGADPGGLLLA